MHLLVTGGCGFIGSNFIRGLLAPGREIHVWNLDALTYAGNRANLRDLESDPRYHFIHGDIRDQAVVQRAFSASDPDCVVHFAAESHVDRSITDAAAFVTTNVLGTHVLLDEARKVGLRLFVHVSTDEVYGSRETGSFREPDPLNPSSPYSASKAGSDLLARSYFVTYGLPVIVTRCTNNFGPYQFPEKLIPLFISNLIEGAKVPVYGTGRNVRDWIYVKDHCSAIEFLIGKGVPGEIYNIGSGNELTNLDITKELIRVQGKDESVIEYVRDRPGHDFRYSLDTTRIRAMGWRPEFEFGAALEATIAWYRENEAWWYPLKHRGA